MTYAKPLFVEFNMWEVTKHLLGDVYLPDAVLVTRYGKQTKYTLFGSSKVESLNRGQDIDIEPISFDKVDILMMHRETLKIRVGAMVIAVECALDTGETNVDELDRALERYGFSLLKEALERLERKKCLTNTIISLQ